LGRSGSLNNRKDAPNRWVGGTLLRSGTRLLPTATCYHTCIALMKDGCLPAKCGQGSQMWTRLCCTSAIMVRGRGR
jgi:hypothetical protein